MESPHESTLYSIGHGRKEIAHLIEELTSFGIEYVVDIRSKPYSRWNPQYNRDRLSKSLADTCIRYVFAGDTLGGRPEDPSLYDENGKVDYEKVKKTEAFQSGLERLLTAHGKGILLAVLCSETRPEDCHRSKLVGAELLKRGISLKHIVGVGELRMQEEVGVK